MRSPLTLMFLCELLRLILSEDWCERKCGNSKHLRCEYELLKGNQKCPKIESGFSPAERMQILDAHNRWRDYVASGLGRVNETTNEFFLFLPFNNKSLLSNSTLDPDELNDPASYHGYRKRFYLWRDDEGQAADMRQLVWDYDLERNAAIWASQCSLDAYRPYQCANTAKFKEVHMNSDASPKRWTTPVLGFYAFLLFMGYADNYYEGDRLKLIRSYQPGPWDTFYALVYSKTFAVGCSRALCHCHQHQLPFGDAGSVTCLYGPTFDHTGSGYKMYEVDKNHCSKCPDGTACRPDSRYVYLCARPDDPKQPAEIPDGPSGDPEHQSSMLNLCCALAILFVTF